MSSNPAALKFAPTQIAALKPTGKTYDISDPAAPNLLLRIGPTGTKRWLFRYQWKKKRTRIALGDFPQTGVAQAREKAIAHQNEINRGIDPRHTQRSASATARDGNKHLPIAPKSSNGAMPKMALQRISNENPFSIPKPTDPEDKHSIHFLAFEYVEFYVKRRRENSREVVRILKKDVLPYWADARCENYQLARDH